MQFAAKAKYVWYTPYKLRPLVDVIRGKDAQYAISWLSTYGTQRSIPVMKVIKSAVANAKNLNNIEPVNLIVKELKVDQGPIYKYYKPGAQGRAMPQRRRLSHISVTLESKETK